MNNKDFDAPVTYVTPAIETLSDQDILEELGPAQAYTGTLPFQF
ncbi:MAG TPA: hypothetical protein VFE84_13265 [Patescibacteria group bacterium]|jgi:hypothetical protein|nr:hypothetical protein [Patescibacteria group bacterium]